MACPRAEQLRLFALPQGLHNEPICRKAKNRKPNSSFLLSIIIYVKALSNGEWFGGWAPVQARLEWLRPDQRVGLFTLTESDLDEDDEYEYFEEGSLLLAVREEGDFKVKTGLVMAKTNVKP